MRWRLLVFLAVVVASSVGVALWLGVGEAW